MTAVFIKHLSTSLYALLYSLYYKIVTKYLFYKIYDSLICIHVVISRLVALMAPPEVNTIINVCYCLRFLSSALYGENITRH